MGARLTGEGMYAHTELIHFVLQRKLTEHYKAIILPQIIIIIIIRWEAR